MKISLWKGYHNTQLKPIIEKTWADNDLLILCPPTLNNFKFINNLPSGDLEFIGEWADTNFSLSDFSKNLTLASTSELFHEKPVLGVFTSGTISGEHRLVLYSKKNILSSLNEILSIFEEKKITSIFCYPQPFHTFGLLLGYVLSIHKKIPLYAFEGKYSRKSHEIRVEINDPGLLTLGTPTHFYDLMEIVEKNKLELAPSYTCIIGGAPVTVSMWKNVQEKLNILKPSIGYGCTEASPGITHHPPGQVPVEDGEIGYPLKNLESIALGNKGVEIRGDSLCLAFSDKKDLIFPKSLVIRDNIEVRESSMWVYKGRIDYILNRGGMKISLELIERTILERTGFNIISVARPDIRLGQELAILHQVDKLGTENYLEKLNNILLNKFSLKVADCDYKEVSEFPHNESMKVDRKAVLNLFTESLEL